MHFRTVLRGDDECGISNPNDDWSLELYSTELLPANVKAIQSLSAKIVFQSLSS